MDDLDEAQRAEVERFEAGEDLAEGAQAVDLRARRPLTKVVPIRMSDEQWDLLRQEARDLGVRPTTLLRMWVLERLRAVKERAGLAEAGRVGLSRDEIARPRETAGLPEGSEQLVREFLSELLRLVAAPGSGRPAGDASSRVP